MTDTDLWATAREYDEQWPADTSNETVLMARLALDTKEYAESAIRAEAQAVRDTEAERDTAREDAEYRRAVADVLKAKHEGGSGAFWAEWHRDHCAAVKAAAAARAEVADLRDRLARVAVECAVTTAKDEVGERWVNVNALRAALGDADTLAERCPVSDAALGRCVLDAHDGDIHAWEGVAGPPGPPQRWQSSERADRIEGATDE